MIMYFFIVFYFNNVFAADKQLIENISFQNSCGLGLFVSNYLIPLYKPDITSFCTWNDFKYHHGFEYQSLRLVNKDISNKLKYEFSTIRKWVDNRRMPAGFLLKYPEDDLSVEEKKYIQFIVACKANTFTKNQFNDYSEYVYSTATGYLLYNYFSQHSHDRGNFVDSVYSQFVQFVLNNYKEEVAENQKIVFEKIAKEIMILQYLYDDKINYINNSYFHCFINLIKEVEHKKILESFYSDISNALDNHSYYYQSSDFYINNLVTLRYIDWDSQEQQLTIKPIYYGYGPTLKNSYCKNNCEFFNIDYYKDCLKIAHKKINKPLNNNLIDAKKIHSYEFFITILLNIFRDFFDQNDKEQKILNTDDYYQVNDLAELCNETTIAYCSFKNLNIKIKPYLDIYFQERLNKNYHGYEINKINYLKKILNFLLEKNIIPKSLLVNHYKQKSTSRYHCLEKLFNKVRKNTLYFWYRMRCLLISLMISLKKQCFYYN